MILRTEFRRGLQAGFTLVELLIVVIILGILAAIVVPQFTTTSDDAKVSAIAQNLSSMRSAIEIYRAQHGKYPGATVTNAGAACASPATKGTASSANTQQAFLDQMMMYTDANGNACSIGDTAVYKFGPYIKPPFPVESLSGSGAVAVTSTGAPITAGAGGGWATDTVSGQYIANNTATLSGKVLSSL